MTQTWHDRHRHMTTDPFDWTDGTPVSFATIADEYKVDQDDIADVVDWMMDFGVVSHALVVHWFEICQRSRVPADWFGVNLMFWGDGLIQKFKADPSEFVLSSDGIEAWRKRHRLPSLRQQAEIISIIPEQKRLM